MTNSKYNHLWSILCRDVTVDQSTGLVSIFNIVENLTTDSTNPQVAQKKSLKLGLKIVSRILINEKTKSDSEFVYRISIITPNGDKILPDRQLASIIIPKGKDNIRIIDDINAIPFSGFGLYKFIFEIKEGKKFKETHVLPVNILDEKLLKMDINNVITPLV